MGKIDSAETHAGNENVNPIAQWVVLERIDSLSHGFGTVGLSPPRSHFSMSFLNGHLQRRVSHRKRYELLPMFRARQSPGSLKPFVKRSGGGREGETQKKESLRAGG